MYDPCMKKSMDTIIELRLYLRRDQSPSVQSPGPPFSSVLLVCSAPLSCIPECRAPRVYECVWYCAVFTVHRRSSFVRSSRVSTPAVPSARRARAQFLRIGCAPTGSCFQ
ncbi:hypothetical protein EVAR_98483_1 [Eumeta japonica]|uniref:Uncharacterized protein n=1 Tax=Eumeta variegata TaxID=151549 RepID=A0A4C1YES4_EUMVA|nr:hypothetical protein EVAR_98483_1 [Eumeta japonica]